jgi:hypothetical protein
VQFDWSDTKNPSTQEMHLVSFLGGNNPVTYPFSGLDGGNVSVTGGQHWFVAYNSDTETTQTSGNTYQGFRISGLPRDLTRYITDFHNRAESFTRFGVRKEDGTRSVIDTEDGANAPAITDSIEGSDLNFIWEPERVWVSTAQDISVVPGTDQTLVMKMWAATYQYTFLIHNVANLDRVSSISATLSCQASGYSPAEHRPDDYTVAEIFSFHKVDASSIRGNLRVFGHSPGEDVIPYDPNDPANTRQSNLTLYVTMDNGNRYGFEYDVTADMMSPKASDIDSQTGEIIINIQIDDIPIPDQPPRPSDMPGTGFFDLSVDDFEVEEWDIIPN